MKVDADPGNEDAVGNLIKAIVNDIPGASVYRKGRDPRFAELSVPPDADVIAIAEALDHRPDVLFSEPNFVTYGSSPDDAHYDLQTALQRIDVEKAWAILSASSGSIGSEDVVIAIIDSGYPVDVDGNPNHEDLMSDRYLPQLDYWNQRLKDAGDVPSVHDFADADGHGTQILGIAAADSDNGKGIAGLNWVSAVYIYRVMYNPGTGAYTTDVKDAVEHFGDILKDSGKIGVVNLSLGSTEADSIATYKEMCDSVTALAGDGVRMMLCCAVGNTDRVSTVQHPARLSVDTDYEDFVIGVGASDLDNNFLSEYSVTGDGVTVIAPGWSVETTTKTDDTAGAHDSYTTAGKTSIATPHVTGLVSLLWSQNKHLTPAMIKECLTASAVAPTGETKDDAPSDGWGWGIIDCGAVMEGVSWVIEQGPSSIEFLNVAPEEWATRYLTFSVTACASLHFSVSTDLTLDAGGDLIDRFDTSGASGEHSGGATTAELQLPIRFQGRNPGDYAAGRIEIACEETGETWTFYVFASTASETFTALDFVLDKSGSMSDDSGVGDQSKIELLRWSAGIGVDVIPDQNAIGVVIFDDDAHEVTGITALDSDETRGDVKAAIESFGPGGLTAIGDGLEKAQERLDGVAGYGRKAIVVFSDGKETADQRIADVLPGITDCVYPIALGAGSAVDPMPLMEAASVTGGYALLIDAVDDEATYELSKFFLQVISDATGGSVLVDPEGRIAPGQEHRTRFWITQEESGVDVLLLMPATDLLDIHLEGPGDLVLDPDLSRDAGSFHRGSRVSFFRLTIGRDSPVPAGPWEAVVTARRNRIKAYLESQDRDDVDNLVAFGVPYAVIVQARSSLRMRPTAIPGSDHSMAGFSLRAVLTEDGDRPGARGRINAEIRSPDGVVETVGMTEVSRGVFEYTSTSRLRGVYRCRLTATGRTRHGEYFQREHILTPYVRGRATGP